MVNNYMYAHGENFPVIILAKNRFCSEKKKGKCKLCLLLPRVKLWGYKTENPHVDFSYSRKLLRV